MFLLFSRAMDASRIGLLYYAANRHGRERRRSSDLTMHQVREIFSAFLGCILCPNPVEK